MGVDKEAMDIWKFGRPRPDLSFDESLAAPVPELSDKEAEQRKGMMRAARDRRLGRLEADIKKDPRGFMDRVRSAGEPTP